MKTLTTLTAALALTTTALSAQTFDTGLQTLTIDSPDRPLEGVVFYPALAGTAQIDALGNQVWQPVLVSPDAIAVEGRHPLVVLSHGMFGNHRNQAWLAQGLVARGYIVAAIDHPGTSTFAKDPDDRRALWQRPMDISRTIDHLLADPVFSALIDPQSIFMAGHSLGGFTAMELAGARYDAETFGRFCDTTPDDLVCGIFAGWQIAQTPQDRVAMEADLSDPRISGFAVLDLGGTQTFSAESLGALTTPMLVYGAPNDINGLDLDVESRALVAALPAGLATYHEPAGLAHFDFLGLCTEMGQAILLDEEPDDAFVCEDGTTERQAEHDLIIDQIDGFFSSL